MIWLAKTVNDRLSVVETLRFQTVKKRFACVSVDMKNAVTTVKHQITVFIWVIRNKIIKKGTIYKKKKKKKKM